MTERKVNLSIPTVVVMVGLGAIAIPVGMHNDNGLVTNVGIALIVVAVLMTLSALSTVSKVAEWLHIAACAVVGAVGLRAGSINDQIVYTIAGGVFLVFALTGVMVNLGGPRKN